jgi:hypothetical protein
MRIDSSGMTLDSLDDRIDVTFSARGALKPAMMTLHSDDMAVMQVQGGLNEDAKMKLEDDVSRNGFVFTRGDGANNKLQLDRMYPGGGTITCIASRRLVTSDTNLHFQNLDLGDMISVMVQGVEQVRTILSIDLVADPNTLEISSMFANVDVTASVWQQARRVMTAESDDITVFGGCSGCTNSGSKQLVLSSTDNTAELTIEGTCTAAQNLGGTCTSSALLTMDAGADAEIMVGAGPDATAALILRDQNNKRGWELSRTGAAANVLRLERTTDGPGGTLVAGSSPAVSVAGSTLVHAKNDGDFATMIVGDQVCIYILTVQTCRTVDSIDLDTNPDQLTISAAFSATIRIDYEKFFVKRHVMAYDGDHAMTFGASAGDKTVTISSTAGAATVAVAAQDANKDAVLTLTSAAADAAATVTAGPDQQARLELRDTTYGYVLARDTGGGDENTLSLSWTEELGSTISVTGGATTVASSGAFFGDVRVGHSLSVVVAGQRLTRKVTAVDTVSDAAAHTATIDVQFTPAGTDLSAVAFEHGKQVLGVKDDGGTVQIGADFTDSAPVDLAVSGDVTMAGLMALDTQVVVAGDTISVHSSHLYVSARAAPTANLVTVREGVFATGTLVFVENRDDNELTGDLDCPGRSKCIFVCSPEVFGTTRYAKFAQVDLF